jgi:hypothetical protein
MPLLREGTNPIWGVSVIVYLVGCIAADFYFLITESGPVRWLAEIQASLFGGTWVPKLTLLLILLAQIGVMLVIKKVIERVTGKPLTMPNQI